MRPIIEVENIGKRYQLGTKAERYPTLRDAIVGMAKAPFKRFRELSGHHDEKQLFWALKDVSFQVPRGEVIGIIGRNGAGKSTLLKILSRITEPTEGRAILRGRVASLLEVGTGFHQELSGRENIYLNGSILGMKKSEIDRKFDEIVAFAEIEEFLDTPVKRYSSGMYVRLAFAVAAHLEPEILIVDEVLAVGDAAFQEKCLGKMRQVASGEGRTVLFVSHNMNAVTTLCRTGLLLKAGRVVKHGTAQEIVQLYSSQTELGSSVDLSKHPNRTGGTGPYFQRIELLDGDGIPSMTFDPETSMQMRFLIRCHEPIRVPHLGVGISNWRGERVFAVADYLSPKMLPAMSGDCIVTFRFTVPALMPGRYVADISLNDGQSPFLDEIHGAAAFEIAETNYLNTSHGRFSEMGHVMVRSQWSIERASEALVETAAEAR